MKFNAGDKIVFKNESLSGVVLEIRKGGKIKVLLEDGFDIDVSENEIIKITSPAKELDESTKKEEPEREEIPVTLKFGREGEINFVTLPAEENHVLSGPVIFVIENLTDYDLPYSFSYKTVTDIFGIACGVIKTKTQFHTRAYHRSEIKLWTALELDLLFYHEDHFLYRKPFTKQLSKQLPELQIADKTFAGRNAFARMQIVCNVNGQPVNFEQLKNAFNPKSSQPFSTASDDIFSYSSALEVDLHIERLSDRYGQLSNAEILEIQMTEFRRKMNEAIIKKVRSVIFIHGVGDGILKHCIHKELNDYNGIRFRAAPVGKYGFGATEVLL